MLQYIIQSLSINTQLSNDDKIYHINSLIYNNDENYQSFMDQVIWNQTLTILQSNPDALFSAMKHHPIYFQSSSYLKVTSTHTHMLLSSLLSSSPYKLQQAIQIVKEYKHKWPWKRDTIYLIFRHQLSSSNNHQNDISQPLAFLQSLIGYIPFVQLQDYHYLLRSTTNPQQAMDILNAIQLTQRNRQYAIQPTSMTYTLAITHACQNNIQMACTFLQLATTRNHIQPNVYLYTTVIWIAAKSFISTNNSHKKNHQEPSSSSSSSLVDIVLSLLQQMKEQSIQPNEITYDGGMCILNYFFS